MSVHLLIQLIIYVLVKERAAFAATDYKAKTSGQASARSQTSSQDAKRPVGPNARQRNAKLTNSSIKHISEHQLCSIKAQCR